MPHMETLRRVLLETPIYACIFLGLVELAIVALFLARRTKRLAMLLVVPAVLAGLVLTAAAMIETDREQIFSAIREICADLEAGQTGAMEQYLADDFVGVFQRGKLTKSTAVQVARMQVGMHGIERIRLRRINVQVEGGEAQMALSTLMIMEQAELGRATGAYVKFDLTWTKTPAGWRLKYCQEPRISAGPLH